MCTNSKTLWIFILWSEKWPGWGGGGAGISGNHEPVSCREIHCLIEKLGELNHLFGWRKKQHDNASKNINFNLIYISEQGFNYEYDDIPFLLKSFCNIIYKYIIICK